ncbi:MAG: hypothetical protein V1743_00765 [Nanoarchaeota archaeon]
MKPIPPIKKRIMLLAILCVSLIILLLPQILRMIRGNENLIGAESYEAIRIAGLVKDNATVDLLSGERIEFNLFHHLIALFESIIPALVLAKIIPVIFGMCAAVLLSKVLSQLKFSQEQAIIAIILFLISPGYLYVYSTLNQYSLIIILFLAGASFLLADKHYLCGFCISAILFIDILSFLIALALIFIHAARSKEYPAFIKTVSIAALFLAIAVIFFSFIPRIELHLASPSFSTIFVNFGGILGLGIPLFILFLISFAANWKKAGLLITACIVLLVSLSFFESGFTVFLNLFVVAFGALALSLLINRRWELQNIKFLTILLIVCTLLFSSLSYINRLSSSQPSPHFSAALMQVKTANPGFVLTHESYAPYVYYFSQKGMAWNRSLSNAPLDFRRDMHAIYLSRDLKETESLLQKHDIGLIFITKEMEEGLVWEKENQGLEFLLPNTPRFKLLYNFEDSTEKYTVWEYRKE